MQSFARKAGRMMLIVISVLLACILGLVGVLQFWSYPGKPKPFVDENGNPLPGSISEKIHVNINYLMGHSGGTFIGIQAAARAPQLYHAYIGVAQMSNQLESEKLAYDYMLEQFK